MKEPRDYLTLIATGRCNLPAMIRRAKNGRRGNGTSNFAKYRLRLVKISRRSRRDGDAGKKKGVLRVARYPAERPWSRTHNAVEVVPV